MSRIIPLLALCVMAPVAGRAEEKAIKIVLLSGSKEYQSETTLPLLKAELEKARGVSCVFIQGEDKGTNLPGLEAISDADVVVVFTRRITLPPEQIELLKKYCDSGKGIVGIRTASHAFQNWLEFDKEVLGGDYQGHDEDAVAQVKVKDEAQKHPVVSGFSPFSTPGTLYRNPKLAQDAEVLMTASTPTNEQPVAWVRLHKGGRVFYTSLGHPKDFENSIFVRMLVNATLWAGGRP